MRNFQKDIGNLERQQTALLNKMQKIMDLASSENRDINSKEQKEFDGLNLEVDRLRGQCAELRKQQLEQQSSPVVERIFGGDDDAYAFETSPHEQPHRNRSGNGGPEIWKNCKTGENVFAFRPQDRISDYIQPKQIVAGVNPKDLSFGRFVRAVILGNWKHADAERQLYQASTMTTNTSSGYLVNDVLSNQVIDAARAKMVMVAAGAKTITWDGGGDMLFARVKTDPTVSMGGETSSSGFTETSVSFDQVRIVPYTIGILCVMSRELLEDSLNGAQAIENAMSKSLAVKFDWYALQGTGSNSPLGIINMSGVNTITSVGAPNYGDIIDAIKANDDDNHDSNSMIINPDTKAQFAKLLRNSEANNYVSTLPPGVSDLKRLVTTGIPTTGAIVGDFTQAILGIRQGITLQVSTEAEDYFSKHEIGFKIWLRGNIVLEHSDAFCVLSGIT